MGNKAFTYLITYLDAIILILHGNIAMHIHDTPTKQSDHTSTAGTPLNHQWPVSYAGQSTCIHWATAEP